MPRVSRLFRGLWLLATGLVLFAQTAGLPDGGRQEAFATLKTLTERFPHRLAGSPEDHAAHAWAAERFRDLGLDVRQEAFPLPRTWSRGPATLRFQGAPLRVAQFAWSPATPGRVTGPLVRVTSLRDLANLPADLHGAILLAGEPATALDPPQMLPPLRLRASPPAHGNRLPIQLLARRLEGRGIAAFLTDAGKSSGRLDMDALFLAPTPGEAPSANVAHEDYQRLWRAAPEGPVELELGGSFGPPGQTFNTVAELRGRQPGSFVLVGAHLDAFDLGTGATDNGAGVAAVLEAARLLTSPPARPRRSIRFALFGAEEQGFLGSQAYVEAHRHELAKASAVFILDTGAGAVDGVALQGRADLLPLFLKLTAPLRALGVTETDLRSEGGTDHLPFHLAGVPAFCLEQVQHTYARDHHSEADTLEAVDPREVQQCATVLARLARSVADLKDPLARGPRVR